MESNDIINQLRTLDGMKPNPTPEQTPEPVAPIAATPEPTPEPVAPVVTAPVETPVAPTITPTAGAAEDVTALRAKLAEYEAKSSLSPFASDLVKKINEIASSGASLTEIQRYIEIQSIDISGLDDEKVIKTAWRLENPAYNDQEIDALYQDRFGADEDDSNAVLLASARRKSEALGARAKLAEQKVNSVPEQVRQAELNAARYEQSVSQWAPVVAGLGSTIDMSVNDEGLEVPFKYSVPEHLIGDFRKKATEWAASNGIPLNQEGAKQVEQFISLAVWASKGPEIQKALARNAYEAGVKATKAAEAGVPAGTPQFTPPVDATTDVINRMKAMDRETMKY